MASEMSQPLSPDSGSQVPGSDKRSTEGRQRPYKVLRALAKVFTVFAPLFALVMLYNAFVAWFIEETLWDKVHVSVEFLVKAVVAFIVLQAAGQLIYLVFDIARNVSQLREEVEGGK